MLSVVAACIVREGKVLLVKRPYHKKRGGLWEFPGGKIEGKESPEEALVRELKEELGIEVTVGRELVRIKHAYPDEEIELILFEAHFEGDLSPKEAEEICWIPIEAIRSLDLCPADLVCLKAIDTSKKSTKGP